jgi:hypothetical protein
MEAPTFSISFPADFRTRYRAARQLTHRLWNTWVGYAFFLGVPTVILVVALLEHWDLSRPGAFGLPGWGVILASYAFILVFMPLLQMFQLWASSRRNQTIRGIQTHTFGPDGFLTRSDTFNTTFKWDAIYKVVETKRFFFLYISSRAAYYVPKNKISTAAEVDRLRQVLTQYLGGRAKLRLSKSEIT